MVDFTQSSDFSAGRGLDFARGAFLAVREYQFLGWGEYTTLKWGNYSLIWGEAPSITAATEFVGSGLSFTRETAII